MPSLVNKNRFIKALAYASEHHFSKPYSISPVVNRWFNQRSIVQLEDGKIIQLSGSTARKYMDIAVDWSYEEVVAHLESSIQEETNETQKRKLTERLDALKLAHQQNDSEQEARLIELNQKVSSDDISLIERYFSQSGGIMHEIDDPGGSQNTTDEFISKRTERFQAFKIEVRSKIDELQRELVDLQKIAEPSTKEQSKIKKLEERIAKGEELYKNCDKEFARASRLYREITTCADPIKGEYKGKISVNTEEIARQEHSKVKKIMHRPNHGITHSVRAAHYVTMSNAFKAKNRLSGTLTENRQERLQMMMLFSVVGRRDETGWADTGGESGLGRRAYQQFRARSGKAFIQYFKDNPAEFEAIYGTGADANELMYRDALAVELMGNPKLPNFSTIRHIPEVAYDFVIDREANRGRVIDRERAASLIRSGYIDTGIDHSERQYLDTALGMMNDCHALDLIRCYSLHQKKDGGSSIGSEFTRALSGENEHYYYRIDGSGPSKDQIRGAFHYMRYAMDLMEQTGNKTTFPWMSSEQFEAVADELVEFVKETREKFADVSNRGALLDEAREMALKGPPESEFNSNSSGDGLLKEYFNYVVKQGLLDKCALQRNYTIDVVAKAVARLDSGETAGFHPLVKDAFENDVDGFKAFLQETKSKHARWYNKDGLLRKAKEYAKEKKCDYKIEDSDTDDDIIKKYIKSQVESDTFTIDYDAGIDEIVSGYQNYKTAIAASNKIFIGDEKYNQYQDQMFQFENPEKGSVTEADYLQNAANLVHELGQCDLPYGLEKSESLPKIRQVKHQDGGPSTLIFDDQTQADAFKNFYKQWYGESLTIEAKGTSSYTVSIPRDRYQMMLAKRLIEFNLIEIPKTVSEEESLVTEDGTLNVMSIIGQTKALARVVSTTALGGEDFPDYDYLLRAYEDPMHERYASKPSGNHNPLKWRSPVDGTVYEREFIEEDVRELRFQEPIYEARNFIPKKGERWLIRKTPGEKKHTAFTKKMSHSLIGPDGSLVAFKGYKSKRDKYFPIGILSSVDEVDLSGERYIWASNIASVQRHWTSTTLEEQLPGMMAKLEVTDLIDTLKESRRGEKTLIDAKERPEKLFEEVKTRWTELGELLGSRRNVFQDTALEEIEAKIDIQYKAALSILNNRDVIAAYDGSDPEKKPERLDEIRKKITDAHKFLKNNLAERKAHSSNYSAISLKQLQQKLISGEEQSRNNELLVANTKTATKAIFANTDSLFYRLNLASHAVRIKEKYGLDVPMMIITEKGTPRRYSEEELKQDLLKAMEVIQDQQQQTKQHDKVGFFDYGDDEVDKNIDMQKEIYAGLFGLYDPAITSFEQLADDKRGTNPLSAKALASKSDEVVDRILTRINLIGGLKREKQRVDEAILDGSTAKLEQCLIREAALGHETLIDSILSHDGFKPDLDILIKAKNAAAKNHHETLAAKVGRMLGDYQNDEQDVNRLIEGAAAEISETTDSIAWCHKIAIAELRQIEVCDKYNSKSLAGSVSDFFQKPSINDHNFTKMRDYLKQELSAPEYKRFLTLVSKSNPKLTQRLIGQFASGNFEQLKGDINHDQIEEIYETHNTIINQIKAAGGLEEVNQYVSLLLAGQSDKAQVIKTIYEADFEINAPKAAAKYLEIVDEYPEAAIFFNRAIGNKETKIVDNLLKLNGQQMLNYQKLLANPLLDQVAEAYVGLVSTGKTEFAEMLFDSTKSSNISEKEMQTIRTKESLLNITGDHQQHQSEKSDAIMRAYNVSTAKSLNGRDIIFDNLMKMIQSGSYTRQEITTATINSNLPSDCTTAFDFVLRGVEYKHKLNEQAELADQDGLYYARFDDSDWLSITSLAEPVITGL